MIVLAIVVPCYNAVSYTHLDVYKRQVQCLEVAEHLPLPSAAILVDSLVKHGDIVLFSAAPKGQGGDHHVNEQDYEFWRQQFARHGYVPFDFLRPLLLNDDQICLLYTSRCV